MTNLCYWKGYKIFSHRVRTWNIRKHVPNQFRNDATSQLQLERFRKHDTIWKGTICHPSLGSHQRRKRENKITATTKPIKVIIRLLKYGWLVKRKGWWYKFPFLPIPPKAWLLWRLETAWGIDSMNPKWKDFPTIPVMIHDVYNFGHWLTQFK